MKRLKEEFIEKFTYDYGVGFKSGDYFPLEVWGWINKRINEAKIEENKRTIKMFISLSDTEFTDLEIRDILKQRNLELENK